jgi:hypothetical protein
LPAVSKDAARTAPRVAMVRDARASPALLTMRLKESKSLCRDTSGLGGAGDKRVARLPPTEEQRNRGRDMAASGKKCLIVPVSYTGLDLTVNALRLGPHRQN